MNSFNEEVTSVWSFKERGEWATHKGDYPGNCSPYVVKNLLIKYSNKNDIVLDQFVGSGTTMIESLLLNRKTIGIDINDKALNITKSRIKDIGGKYKLIKGDATKLTLKNKSIDFICTHPPYMDIIKYSNGITGDISLLSGEEFYNSIMFDIKDGNYSNMVKIILIDAVIQELLTKKWFEEYYESKNIERLVDFILKQWYATFLKYYYERKK